MFVEERLLQLVKCGGLNASVVAPVPWFPASFGFFGRYARFAKVAKSETRHGVSVAYPRYLVIPKIGMTVAPWLLAMSQFGRFRRLRQQSPEPFVIDAHYLYPDGVAASLLGRWLGLPVVLTARGSDVNVFTKFAAPKAMIRSALKHCERVITVSEALRAKLLELDVPPDRVVTLRNGVDLERFRPSADREGLRKSLGFSGTTLLCVGNLVELKGHALAIEAVASLPDVDLVIIGEGPLETRLCALIDDLGIGDRVRLLGNRPQSELADYYCAADALLLPSSREGMPNVVLESLACGTPVLATGVGGVPEIVNSPAAGVIIEERSGPGIVVAVRSLMASYPDRSATRSCAEELGWAPTVRGLLDVFREAARA
ncbi:MAG: glycosyltransferase family 4 protein [Gammaproteobacteria bacterium]